MSNLARSARLANPGFAETMHCVF